jgi:hypothetical protein
VRRSLNLTAIIPFHNFSINFPKLINLLNVTKNFEIDLILIADSLNDDDFRQLSIVVDSFTNLNLLRCDFKSAAQTRNLGLRTAKSEWIVFWDCDDMVYLSAYQDILIGGDIGDADLIVSQIEIRSQSRGINLRTSATMTPDQIGVFPAFTRFIYRRTLIGDTQFVPIPLCEDQCFLAEILIKNPKIVFSGLTTYQYVIDNPFQGSNTLFAHDSHRAAAQFIWNLITVELTSTRFSRTLQIMSLRLLLSSLKRMNLNYANQMPRLLLQILRIVFTTPSILFFVLSNRPKLLEKVR